MALIELYAALYQEYKRILTVRQYEVLRLKEVEGLSGKQMRTSWASVNRRCRGI